MFRRGLRWAGRAGGGVLAAGGCLGVPGMSLAAAPTMGSASFTTPGEYSPTVPAGGSAITATVVGGAGGACSAAGRHGDSRRSTDGH
jgi:hypothetical protein